ncbi:hypothetical protein CTEN210_17645 [Chaetoceros tenuissimus]|uniref:Integrase zinc-binding domain-containing protein n=1 Tax=Chaetoceros tenuissimus TaxID=426638 RepID=A0AAD3DEG3_9STRA|nr:hypothetical protein CTEN210_17645 [Chaetoceros tenuissimus]
MPSTNLDNEQQELHLAELLDVEARNDTFPLDYKTVRKEQQREIRTNQKLAQLIEKSEDFGSLTYDDVDLIIYKNRMYVPQILRQRTLTWYHYMLCHPGGSRLANTIGTAANWPGIHNHAAQFCKKCKICQKFKKRNQKYSELPPKTIETPQPWHTVAVDLIGPYKINAKQL